MCCVVLIVAEGEKFETWIHSSSKLLKMNVIRWEKKETMYSPCLTSSDCLVQVWRNYFQLFYLFFSGWGSHHAAHSLDASREYNVQEVHHRKWCLEPGCCIMGNLYLWQTAVVSALKQRGVCNIFSNCIGKDVMLIIGVSFLEKGQHQIYFLKADTDTWYLLYFHGLYG